MPHVKAKPNGRSDPFFLFPPALVKKLSVHSPVKDQRISVLYSLKQRSQIGLLLSNQQLPLKGALSNGSAHSNASIPRGNQRMYLPHKCVSQPNGPPVSVNPMGITVVGGGNVVANGTRKSAGAAWQALTCLNSARIFHMRRRTNLCNNGRTKHREGILEIGKAGDRT
jgi:hypothetical protein